MQINQVILVKHSKYIQKDSTRQRSWLLVSNNPYVDIRVQVLYHKNGNQLSIVSTYKTHTYTYICNTIIIQLENISPKRSKKKKAWYRFWASWGFCGSIWLREYPRHETSKNPARPGLGLGPACFSCCCFYCVCVYLYVVCVILH